MAKLLLEARDVSKAYGLRPVLASLDFDLYDGERVGLVGENGAGKSTFLHILAGDLLPDDGLITRRAPVSLISQFGDAAEASLDPALGSEFAAPPAREGLSGGEKTRRRIAGALSGKSQVLLADEPTTDLDAAGIQRLEKHLRAYPGALVLISHDRALLDGVCTRIVELEDGKLTSFPGNYSAYRQEKQRRRSFQQFKYEQYRAEEKRIRTMIQRETELASQKTGMPKRMGNSEARLHKREDTVVQGKIHQVRKMFESRLGRLE